MPEPYITRAAAETMAFRARECQSTVTELFSSVYEVSFDLPGYTDHERIEHTVDITPDLIRKAEGVLAKWQAHAAAK